MPFVNPNRFTNMEDLLKEQLGKPEVSREGNPRKFIDRTDPRFQESLYAEPDSPPMMDPGNLGGTVASAGGGIKNVLGKITAGPWRSRTLEAIEKNPKLPASASPQTWLSKLKGAGLPKDEVAVAENFLGDADPKSKLSREQLHTSLNQGKAKETYENAYAEWQGIKDFRAPGELAKAHKLEDVMERSLNASNLPSLGVTKTTLGGREWEYGQQRLNDLPELIKNSKELAKNRIAELYKETGGAVPEEVYRNDPKWKEAYNQTKDLVTEQMKHSQDAVGKRPKWPQYNIEGLKDYKEEYFHAPLKEGGTYRNADMEMHFSDKPDNLLYLKHQGTLELPDGKKSTHMSTLQNDHAAEYDRFKGKAGYPVYATETIMGDMEAFPLDDIRVVGNSTDGFGVMHRPTGRILDGGLPTRSAAELIIKENTGENPRVPEPIMLNTWWKHGLKSSLRDAVKQGHDYFTWDPADTQMKRFAGAGEDVAQYMKNHYDNNIPGFLKKEYGVEAKKVTIRKEGHYLPDEGIFDPHTGENIPRDQLRVVEGRAGHAPDEYIYYDIGREYPDGRTINIGLTEASTRQQAQRDLDHYLRGIDEAAARRKSQQDVWQIPITEEIKKKVQEGQFWSKAARPGGKNAEGIA